MRTLIQDLRFGFRMALRSPGFTLIAVLTLAAGIAANSTVFSWIDGVLLHPVPGVTDPARLVAFETVAPNGDALLTSYPDYRDYRDHLKLISGLTGATMLPFSIGQDVHAEHVWGELVTGNYFAVLGVKPILGRVFTPDEYGDAQGAHPVLVISERLWKRRFNADPGAIGQLLRVNRQQLTIVGVVPATFLGSIPGLTFDMWAPVTMGAQLKVLQEGSLEDRGTRQMFGFARLRPGVTLEQARAEIQSQARHMAEADPEHNLGITATVLPIWKAHSGAQTSLLRPLILLMAVCGVVLLIVCANVANLLLARATVREKEFTARLALGAGRARLARQVLTESLLLTGSGAALGLIVTPWMSHALKYLMPPGPMQQLVAMDTRPNLSVLGFAAGICIFAALAAGLVPALQVGRLNLSARLNAGGRSGTAGRGRNRLRSVLVGSEVALALVTLVGAGLFARGFQTTMRIDPGFDPNHVLLSQFYLNTNGYNLAQRKEFCRRLAERMQSAPGVTDVAYSDGVPLGFEPSWWEELKIEGYAPRPNENMSVFRNVISPGYLPLMHIPIVEGRNFTEQDNEDEKSPAVMIVNQAFVRRFLAGRDPIGTRIHGWGSWFRVVGVAKDSKYHYLGESTPAYFYVPFRQIFREDMNLAFYVRTKGEPDSVLSTLRAQVRGLDPNVTVFDAAPLKEFIGASLYPQKVAASLMTVLGSIALLLAAVGLYSVMAYSVAQRTQEIGVRMALGAQPGHVLRMVIGQGLALTAGGLIASAVLAIGLARAVASVSFTNSAMGSSAKLLGAGANNPLIYLAAAGFLCAIATLACWLPARRAASIDPMQALRME